MVTGTRLGGHFLLVDHREKATGSQVSGQGCSLAVQVQRVVCGWVVHVDVPWMEYIGLLWDGMGR